MQRKKKDSIPGPIMALIGFVVAAISVFLTNETSNLIFFTIVGVIMGIYGLGKIAMANFTKKTEEEMTHLQSPEAKKVLTIDFCANCKGKIHSNQKYCHHCGFKLQ